MFVCTRVGVRRDVLHISRNCNFYTYPTRNAVQDFHFDWPWKNYHQKMSITRTATSLLNSASKKTSAREQRHGIIWKNIISGLSLDRNPSPGRQVILIYLKTFWSSSEGDTHDHIRSRRRGISPNIRFICSKVLG